MMNFPEKMFNTTSTSVLILNSIGEIVWINDAFEGCFGYCLADLKAGRWPFLSIAHEAKFKAMTRQAFLLNSPEAFDIPVICSDNTIKAIRWSTMLIDDYKNPKQKAVALSGVKTGMPEQINSDIEASEEHYRLFFEHNDISMMFLSEDATITIINKEFEKLTGYTRQQVEGKMNCKELLLYEEDLDRIINFYSLSRIEPTLPLNVYNTIIKTRHGDMRHIMFHVTMVPGKPYSLVTLIDMTETILSERALYESEEKYRSLVDNMQDTLYRCDSKGDITFMSPSGARLLGYDSVKELIGKNILQSLYYHPDERTLFLSDLKANGRVTNYEVTLKRKDGSTVIVSCNSQLLHDKDGNILGVEGILIDLTKRKQTERLLRENEERLRGITANMPGFVFQLYAKDNGEHGITYLNKRLTELYGLPSDPAPLFQAFLSYIHEEDLDRFLASIRKAAETCTSWNFEGRIIRPSGELNWIHGMATPTRHEDGLVFNGILLDITERKRVEEISRQAEEKFAKVFMMTPDAITISRMQDGLIIDVNMGFEEITGWKRGESIGRTSSEINFFVDPSERDLLAEDLRNGGNILYREFQFRRKDGSFRTGIYSGRSIHLGDEACYIFFMQDITDRRLLEDERRRMEEYLYHAEKMDAIGKLSASLAHDFNNILMGIQANAVLMLLECNPEDPHCQRLRRIEEHIEHGANLTKQLLGFAREAKSDIKSLSVNNVIRKSAEFFIETRKGIDADFHLLDDIYPVEADIGQIEQVLFNIYINAGHAMPKGGHLHIQTINVTLQETDAKAFDIKPGDYVKISISDTGTGMDAATLKRIFEPFFTTKSQQGGTGLGLASAYGIIRNHGGAINAHSKPGQGSSFNIYLPSSVKKA